MADSEYSYTLHMTGQATTVQPQADEDDIIGRLHQAVFDVTGKRVEPAPKSRIGFV